MNDSDDGNAGTNRQTDDDVQEDFEVEVTDNVVELKPRVKPQVHQIELYDDRVMEAYDAIEHIHAIRQESTALVAIGKQFWRNKPDRLAAAGAFGIWAAFSLATQSLLFAAVTLPIAAGSVCYKSVKQALRIRRGRSRLHPQIAELRSVWAVMAHRFAKMTLGFNRRVEAVNTLRHDGLLPEAVEQMAEILMKIEPELCRIKAVLRGFQPHSDMNIFDELQGNASRLRRLDPLKLQTASPPHVWLENAPDFISADDFEQVLQQDLEGIAAEAEMNDGT